MLDFWLTRLLAFLLSLLCSGQAGSGSGGLQVAWQRWSRDFTKTRETETRVCLEVCLQQFHLRTFSPLHALFDSSKMNESADKKSAPKRVVRPDNWWQQRAPGPAVPALPLSAPPLASSPPPSAAPVPPLPEKSPLRALFREIPAGSETKRFSSAKGFFKSSTDESAARRDLTPPALRIIKRRQEIERKSREAAEAGERDGAIDRYHQARSRKRQARLPEAPGYLEGTTLVEDHPNKEGWSFEQAYAEAGICAPSAPKIPDYYEDTSFSAATPPISAAPSAEIGLARRRTLRTPRRLTKPQPEEIEAEAKTLPRIRITQNLLQQLIKVDSFSRLPIPEDKEEAEDLATAWQIKERKISHNCIENRDPEHGLTELFDHIRLSPENRR